MVEMVKYEAGSLELQSVDLLSCSAGRQEGPALDTVDHEVARWSEWRIVESLTGLGPSLVQVSVKPQSKLAAPCSDHKILAATLQRGGERLSVCRAGKTN